MRTLPVIDVSALVGRASAAEARAAGSAIDDACREHGFFYVIGHSVDQGLQQRLEDEARAFFARADEQKAEIAMARGGRAWRGWFPVGGELTSGQADRKEGIYFGAELAADDPRVRAGVPLHGPNLFPREPAGLRDAVLRYLDAMTALGHALLRGMARGLGLDERWFETNLTADPTILFRIFHYPPQPDGPRGALDDRGGWGVGEHTDYGLLTILRQDATGGLAVRTAEGWVDAPPIEGSFVCNLGDMLERMTAGRYRSTPHRVRNTSGQGRLSFPFFFDPSWDAVVQPVPGFEPVADADGPDRWDGSDLFAFGGTYGDYLLGKVAKVFPDLGRTVL